MYTYITSALPACKDKDQNISPSVTSAQPTIVPEIITTQDTSVTNKKKNNIEIKTDLDVKAEEKITKNVATRDSCRIKNRTFKLNL